MNRWTDEEVATLREMWANNEPVKPIGVHSRKGVYEKAKVLGLARRITRLDWHKELLAAALAGEGSTSFCLSRNVSINGLVNAEKRHGIKLPRRVPRKPKAEQGIAA